MGPSQDEGYSIPRRNIRPGQAAAPPSYAASAVGGMGFREAGCLRRVWMESSGRRRVGSVVGPPSGDGAIAGQRVPLRLTDAAAADPYPSVVRIGSTASTSADQGRAEDLGLEAGPYWLAPYAATCWTPGSPGQSESPLSFLDTGVRQPAPSLLAFTNPRSPSRSRPRGPGLGSRSIWSTSTDAGCAPTIVRPGDDCRRVEQCLMTPGAHGIFQC